MKQELRQYLNMGETHVFCIWEEILPESLRVNRVPASHRKAIKGGDRLLQEVIREAKVGE